MPAKRRRKRFLIAVIVVLALVEIAGRLLLAPAARERAEEALASEWQGATKIGSVSVSLLRGGIVTLGDIALYSPQKPEKILLSIPTLRFNVNLLAYAREETVFDEVHADGLFADVERLQDTTIAALFQTLLHAAPHSPQWTERAYASANDIPDAVRADRVLITNGLVRVTDHHTHATPATGELTALNLDVSNVVYPLPEGAVGAGYELSAAVPTTPPGKIEARGSVYLFAKDPSFDIAWTIRDLDGLYVDRFIPDDLPKTQIYSGIANASGTANCDRGHLTGVWEFDVHNLKFDLDEGVLGWDYRVARDFIDSIAADFHLGDIPLDCELYNPDFEFQECVGEGIEKRIDTQYQEIKKVLDRGEESVNAVLDSLGPVADKLNELFGGDKKKDKKEQP